MESEKTKLLQSYGLTERMLKKKCSEDHMYKIEKFISWREVGRHLPNISRHDLRGIDHSGHDDEDKRYRLLDKWEEKNGDDATYDVMITAMLKAEKKDQATEVCKLLATEAG